MSQGDPDPTERSLPISTPAELGRAVKVLRTVRDLSRRELAEAAGLSYSYLAEIENGGKQPSSRALAAIADGLGISAAELLVEAEELAVADEVFSSARIAASKEPPEHPQGARARQLRWYESRTSVPRATLGMQAFASPQAAGEGRADRQELERLMKELHRLMRLLSQEDQERVMDLARRLAG